MTAPGDAELVARMQDGDRTAFAMLIDRHKHRLVNYLTRLIRDRDRSEELAQDTFVKLFEHRARYQERGQFLAYLYRIATNLARSAERKRRRQALLLQVFTSNGNGHRDPVPSPQAKLLRDELSVRVDEALEALPLRYRSPLLLREIEGWSYKDIAVALRCREGTVKSRIHRGREQLRALLAPYWNGGRS
jgi:RNA polymerase sigma-70 factor (ECF subfamily)